MFKGLHYNSTISLHMFPLNSQDLIYRLKFKESEKLTCIKGNQFK